MNEQIPKDIIASPSVSTSPETYLRQRDFDALVARKGYKVYHDIFMSCPCKEDGVESHRLTCQNCYGTGYVLIERRSTIAMVAQMNYPTQFKNWTIENAATAQITTLSYDPTNFMDRIVLYEEENIYNELIYPRILDNEEVIAFCAYPPIEILNIKLFRGDDISLLDINPSQVQIDKEGKIILTNIKEYLYTSQDSIYNNYSGISIRYKYHPSYHIIDVFRNLLTSPTDYPTDTISPKGTRVQFPYGAMAKMSHLVLERGNLINFPQGIINNTGMTGDTPLIDQVNNHNISKEFCDTEKN